MIQEVGEEKYEKDESSKLKQLKELLENQFEREDILMKFGHFNKDRDRKTFIEGVMKKK